MSRSVSGSTLDVASSKEEGGGKRDAGRIVRISIDHMVFVLMGNGLTPFYRKSRSMRIHFQALGLFSNRRAQLADSPEVRIDSFPSLFEAAFPSTDFHAFQSVRFPNTFLKLIFLPASRFMDIPDKLKRIAVRFNNY